MVEIKQLPLGALQTNCYFVGCEATKKAAIIDPSDSGHELAQIVRRGGWTLTHILLTHTHFDHVGGLADLKSEINAPIYAHPDSVKMLQYAAQSARRFKLSIPQPPEPDEMLAEGDIINVGGLALEVLLTPGHAPGHVCFYLQKHAVLFDGDVLFRGSIGRTDLPGGNPAQLMQSITEKLLPLPDKTQVMSGHGPITSIGIERQTNPFLR